MLAQVLLQMRRLFRWQCVAHGFESSADDLEVRLAPLQKDSGSEGSVAFGAFLAPYRAIVRYFRCDTPYCFFLSGEVSAPPKWCNTPLGT